MRISAVSLRSYLTRIIHGPPPWWRKLCSRAAWAPLPEILAGSAQTAPLPPWIGRVGGSHGDELKANALAATDSYKSRQGQLAASFTTMRRVLCTTSAATLMS